MTLLDAGYDDRLTAPVSEVDGESGSVKYTLTGMAALQKDAGRPLVDLTFQVGRTAGGQTGIKVNKAVVRQTGEIDPSPTGMSPAPSISGSSASTQR